MEPGERYGDQRNTERVQGRAKGEKAGRLCDADEEWFQHTVEKYSSMMSQLTMQYLGEYDRTVPGFDSEVTRFEQKIAQAFK